MSASSRKLAPAAFSDRPGLPSIFIEKIKILPTDYTSDEQDIELTFSLQSRLSPADLLSGQYMVFVAFSHKLLPLKRMCASDGWAKALIRTPRLKGGVQKEYLKVDRSYKGFSRLPLSVNSRTKSTTLYTKELRCSYRCSLKDLKDLYVYAVPYRTDVQTISKSGVDRKLKAMKIGIPVVETIMRRGIAPLNATTYTLQEDSPNYGKRDQAWCGPVYLYSPERQLLAAKTPGRWNWEAPHPKLKAHSVSNQKIVDMRFINDIRNLSFAVSGEKLKLLSSRQRKDLDKIRKVISAPGQVSDGSYTRTSDNSVKVVFSLDFDRLAEENTRLGSFIQNKNSVASCFQIEDIRVYRTRVDPIALKGNELTPSRVTVRGSNSSIAPEVFVGSLAGGVVTPIEFKTSSAGIRTFVINDDALASVSTGAYEYRIIIDMVDLSTSAMQNITRELNRFLSSYNKFISETNDVGKKGSRLKARMRRESSLIVGRNKAWKKLINAYMTAIEFIYGDAAFRDSSSLGWRKNLIAMTNPANGDIKDIRQVYEIINTFNTNLQRVYKATTMGSSDRAFNVRSKVSADSSSRRKINLEHVFRTKYRPTKTATEGTDYLNNDRTTNNDGNLTNITYAEYEFRIADEMAKFQVPRPNAPGVNKYGFLSPWRINLGASFVDVSTKFVSEEAGNGILNSNLNPNAKIMAPIHDNALEKVYDTEVDDLLGFSDVTVVEPHRSLKDLLARPEPVKEKTTDAGSFLNAPKVTKDIVDTKAAISGSQIPKIKRERPKKRRVKKSKLVKRVISAKAFKFRKLPRPIFGSAGLGSLAIASMEQDEGSTENNSNFGNSINFNSLMEVQYFDGYRTVNGALNLGVPIWRTLDQARFQQFKKEDETILCRLRSVTKAFKIPSYYHMPEYDSLFVLSQTAAPEAPVNYSGGSYTDVLEKLYATMKEESKNVALNIEDTSALVDPMYASVATEGLNVKMISTRRPTDALNTLSAPARPPWRGKGWNWRRTRTRKAASNARGGTPRGGRRARKMSRRKGDN